MPIPSSPEPPAALGPHAVGPPNQVTPLPDPQATTAPNALAPEDAPSPPSLPRFAIERLLGTGVSAAVYQARDLVLGRKVALKVLHPRALSPAVRERFLGEARAVATLDHPHIVKVFDVGETPPDAAGRNSPYLALELVEGGPLAARLGRPLPPREAARLVRLLAEAMAHAHQRGIVHRDLKPDNVLLGEGGAPRVTDFGLARRVEADRRPTGAEGLVGTPMYMAPEQADGWGDVGPKADVWALGVILYQMLTGRCPFEAAGVMELLSRIRRDEPEPPRKLRAGVPAELEAICLACLKKDAPARPTAVELAGRLDNFLRGADRRWRRRAGAAALVALGIGLAWWAAQPPVRSGASTEPAVKAALRVTSFRIQQFEVGGGQTRLAGVVSRDATAGGEAALEALPFAATVQVEAEFSEPGYAYLIAFNADGRPQLRWPVNEQGQPDATLPPPRVPRLRDPDRRGPGGGPILFRLDDEPRGGLQAFAVVLSRARLPSYSAWLKGRELPWGRDNSQGAWLADAEGVYPVVPGRGVLRGHEVEVKVPPLLRLVGALRPNDEVVEVLAVSVGAKEHRP